MAGDDKPFKHHNLELSITPAVDYHFVTFQSRPPGDLYTGSLSYRPLVGVNVGVAYIYRPSRWFGFSAGFNSLEYGLKISAQTGNGPVSGYGYRGYMGFPVLLHAYQQINKTELELSTGPEFLLPLFAYAHYTSANSISGEFSNSYDAVDIQGNATLAWTTQLTATIPIKSKVEIAIGPEMKFLNICPLPLGPYYNLVSHDINFYLGVKVGFKIGSNFFKKKASSPIYKT